MPLEIGVRLTHKETGVSKDFQLPMDEMDLIDEIREMIPASDKEDLFDDESDDDDDSDIKDYAEDDNFTLEYVDGLDLKIREGDSIFDLNDGLDELDSDEDLAQTIVDANPDHYDVQDVITMISRGGDFQYYKCRGLEEVAEMMVDEGLYGEVSDSLKPYIDYDRLGSDLRYDGWEYNENTGIAICFY